MIDNEVRKALIIRHPEKLVDELLSCYREQKNHLLLGHLRPNEVEGGRFAEAVFRLMEHHVGWPVTALGTQLDSDGLIRRLANLSQTQAPDSIRLHIPRTLRVIYDVRNKRDAAHLADGIDPNLQDSMFVSGCMDWVLAELVRLTGGIAPDEAFELVEAITVRQIPAVEDVQGFLKTLQPSLGPKDRVILLLYHRGNTGATTDELSLWLKPAQRRNLPRTLRQLGDEKDLIVLVNGKYYITRRGIREVEQRRLIHIS